MTLTRYLSSFFWGKTLKKKRISAEQLAEMVEQKGRPVLQFFEFFMLVERLHAEREARGLKRLSKQADTNSASRFRRTLIDEDVITPDRDYTGVALRVPAVRDASAEGIATLLDPTCYVSHLSAMQRWGFTNRTPRALHLTRPDRTEARRRLRALHAEFFASHKPPSLYAGYMPVLVTHPKEVRQRPVSVLETKQSGANLVSRSDGVRVATVGQTFLDTVLRPDLCGGMGHVLDVWAEHAAAHLDDVVTAVETAPTSIAKVRAGYLLNERLGLSHPTVEGWRGLAQRGGSRVLDPDGPFASTFSETWMLSLNV